jgi:hypothetical protein
VVRVLDGLEGGQSFVSAGVALCFRLMLEVQEDAEWEGRESEGADDEVSVYIRGGGTPFGGRGWGFRAEWEGWGFMGPMGGWGFRRRVGGTRERGRG